MPRTLQDRYIPEGPWRERSLSQIAGRLTGPPGAITSTSPVVANGQKLSPWEMLSPLVTSDPSWRYYLTTTAGADNPELAMVCGRGTGLQSWSQVDSQFGTKFGHHVRVAHSGAEYRVRAAQLDVGYDVRNPMAPGHLRATDRGPEFRQQPAIPALSLIHI